MRIRLLDLCAAAVIFAGAAFLPAPAIAEPANCPLQDNDCLTYCPGDMLDFCRQLHPGCGITEASCTWWNTSCWGEWDDKFTCRYVAY